MTTGLRLSFKNIINQLFTTEPLILYYSYIYNIKEVYNQDRSLYFDDVDRLPESASKNLYSKTLGYRKIEGR